MSNLLQKFKLLIGKLKTREASYARGSVRPLRDWGVLLSFTFIILSILAILAFYFYVQIKRGSIFVVTNDITENQIKINTSLLKKTVDDINMRKMTNINLKEGKISIPSDPSI